jgi:hypothetical protein
MGRTFQALLLAGLMLGGCVSRQASAPPASAPAPPSTSYTTTGLEAVLGATARALVGQFGNPDLDLREGPARKLQFLGPACVLDAYLYPPRGGRGEPVVTHVDARLPDGREMDRSSCVAALTRRREAR